jgi:tyrosyl-tRNA synthetase
MPSIEVTDAVGKKLLDVLAAAKVIESKAEGRRLIAQNGLTLNDEKISDAECVLTEKDFPAVIRKGKKKFYKLIIR